MIKKVTRSFLRLVVVLLAVLVLLAGAIHAMVLSSTNHRNLRTEVVGVGDYNRSGQIMVSDTAEYNAMALNLRPLFALVEDDHVERISRREEERRAIRRAQLVIDNWSAENPLPDNATAGQIQANRIALAYAEAYLAVQRANFRRSNHNVNLIALQTFFVLYMGPFAMLLIAAAVLTVARKKDEANRG